MRLNGVVVVAAHTMRSRAYLQALVCHGMDPDRVILYGRDGGRPETGRAGPASWRGVSLPDPAETVGETCRKAGWPTVACKCDDINMPEMATAILATAPRLVVFSGYGGQIVGPALLDSGPRFLHVHSGWLPDYRGSTTLYYALLNGDPPAASALILDRNIDTGPVVARRHYPLPPAGMDVDRIYDCAIRADLLVHVLMEYAGKGSFVQEVLQDSEQGTNYYVIHPVLKHLALLSLAPAPEVGSETTGRTSC